MDVETRDIENEKRVYCISHNDGNRKKSFYLTDYKNNEKLLCSAAIKSLMREKYNKYTVYLHNFSHFDVSFLIGVLSELSSKQLKPIIRDGRFIDFKFYFGNYYYFNIRDSYLLIPVSLSKLSKNFGLENKGIFPYLFVNNKNINLDYNGKFPRFKFWDFENKYDTPEYLDYKNSYIKYRSTFKNKTWNLKNETIKYCELDTEILYQVLMKFNEIIYSKYKVNAFKYPTISSLAFAIYRTNYLSVNENNYSTIPIIKDNLYKALKLGYTGGSVDVYKPYGENIFCYDVNSLYPSVMATMPMPVGEPTFFEGDISKNVKFEDLFGFLEVEVNAPLDLKIPLLQKKIETNEGFRTLSPVGKWTGVYFSEELKEAAKLGYTFKILRGYTFHQEIIFKEFITNLYKEKEESIKDSANYIITKITMNANYGRFGMKPDIEKNIIIHEKDLDKFNLDENIIISDSISLKNSKEMVSFFDLKDSDMLLGSYRNLNISVPIAAAITAYGRIFMNKFKNLPGYELYYSDTDSVYLNKELDSKFVGTKLGQFKLERIFEKAIFLAPKLYGGRYRDKDNKLKSLVKIKGFSKKIDFSKLFSLLFYDKHIELEQEKWFRDLSNQNIKVVKSTHKVKITSTKRVNIFDEKTNKFIDTKPIVLDKINSNEEK